MFGEEHNSELNDENALKGDGNRYFSVQKPLRYDSQKEQTIGDDGLILIETGLNVEKKEQFDKYATLNVDFSPEKRKKRRDRMGGVAKKRQLIITGSSPYLEYLPDMMKKKNSQPVKSLTPSQPTLPNLSRKVL